MDELLHEIEAEKEHILSTLKALNGKSTYREYTEENIWNEEIIDDIVETSEKIVNFVKECKSLEEKTYFGKKIVSLDVETTSWIPKALEWFVNVLEITVRNSAL